MDSCLYDCLTGAWSVCVTADAAAKAAQQPSPQASELERKKGEKKGEAAQDQASRSVARLPILCEHNWMSRIRLGLW